MSVADQHRMRRRSWVVPLAAVVLLVIGGIVAVLLLHDGHGRDAAASHSAVRCAPTGSAGVQLAEPGVGHAAVSAFLYRAATASVEVCLDNVEGSTSTVPTGSAVIPAGALGTLSNSYYGTFEHWAFGLIRGPFSAVRVTDGSAPAVVLHHGDAGLYPQAGAVIFARTVSLNASRVVVDVLDSRGQVASTVTLVRR